MADGARAALIRWRTAPPGPFDRAVWRSPLRGPWLASLLSIGLLVLFGIDAITGYLSHAAYQPNLGNSFSDGGLDRHLFGWQWPTRPSWLYAATQGSHVTAGIAAVPILAAKLWAVMPKLYKWPPARSAADALERVLLGLLVGSSILLIATGLLNIAYWYPWRFSFIVVHYYAAYVFVGSMLGHVLIKLPLMRRSFRERGVLKPLRENLAGTLPEPVDPETSAPTNPAAPTVSRRGLFSLVGGSSAALVALSLGESVGGPLRTIALLTPRGRQPGSGPNDFQVNKTAAGVGIRPHETGAAYRLTVRGHKTVELSRDDLLALPQHTYVLPIACVEGWSTTQTWTGVRLRDLARMAGVREPDSAFVESLQRRGSFRHAALNAGQLADHRSLLALKVNGTDLSPDHGFPARVIVPALPGVHNTKWVREITFSGGVPA
jgi:hypothetical protein